MSDNFPQPASPATAAPPRYPSVISNSATIHCSRCGYDLTGSTVGGVCPECGTPVSRSLDPAVGGKTSGYAVASLVLGILSIVGCMVYGLPSMVCGPLAIYFSVLGKRQVRRHEAGGSSQGLAQAGFVLGLIGTIIAALCVLLILMFILVPFLIMIVTSP
ncbi:MAG: DUF4190 domain-containing protein [Phycisphaeraceae bacterium]|nr:DUF4190 domain-containing protein [Phycisphaeraceae bacterium]